MTQFAQLIYDCLIANIRFSGFYYEFTIALSVCVLIEQYRQSFIFNNLTHKLLATRAMVSSLQLVFFLSLVYFLYIYNRHFLLTILIKTI